MNNQMKLEFLSKSENEALARIAVAAFVSCLDPTINELEDIKTAVSEAVTNAIIHGYGHEEGLVTLHCVLRDNLLTVTVEDEGKGISDIERAKEPLYTTCPLEERSGMGFTVMESFTDKLEVFSEIGKGTKVVMEKSFAGTKA